MPETVSHPSHASHQIAAVAKQSASAYLVRVICERIQRSPDATHSAALLARAAGVSASHLQHTFKAALGISLRTFVEAERMKHFRGELKQGSGVLAGAVASGIGSSRGVHERSRRHLGMTAHQFRQGGAGVQISYAGFETPIGRALLGATDVGLCFLHLGDDDAPLLAALQREFPRATLMPAAAAAAEQLTAWADALNAHLRRETPLPSLPVHVRATAFQQRVWQFLQSIPAGETRSYTEVAEAIGSPRAVRAVASACAANNVAVLIPCHRVLRQTGALSGYRWGVERKQALLRLEAGETA